MIPLKKRIVASVIALAASSAIGCSGGRDQAANTNEAVPESSAIRTKALGTLSAITIGDETIGRPSRVFRAVRALDLDNAEPFPGLPRCMGQTLSLLADDGSQAGRVIFCGTPQGGKAREGFLADTRAEAIATYRIHADLDTIAAVASEERVLWDHIWGATSIVVFHAGDDPRELHDRAFRSAFVAVRPLQNLEKDPPIAKCLPDWSFAVKRGSDVIANVDMHCGSEPTSDEAAVLYDVDYKLLGGIEIDGARLAELTRDAGGAN